MKIKSTKLVILALLIIFTVPLVSLNSCLSREEETSSPENPQIIEDINLEEAYALIVDNLGNPDFIIIDLRTWEEYKSGHIEKAINLDYESADFADELNELDKDKAYLIYGQTDQLSGKALDMMAELGFAEVYNLLGGIAHWEQVGLATTVE